MDPLGGMFFSAFLQIVFERDVPREFWSDIWNFFGDCKLDGLLRDLDKAIMAIEKFIDDAESKQFSDPRVKRWLDILRAAFYDAEDILDAIITERMQCKLQKQEESSLSQSQTRKPHLPPSLEVEREGVPKRLNEILERLKELVDLQSLLSLTEGVSKNPSSHRLPTTTSLLDEADLYYGRDGDKEVILESLLSDSTGGKNLDVISIVGMGGVGKTTLAQLVYNDDTVQRHFDYNAWIYIPEDFDVVKLTRNILESFNSSTSSINSNLDLLQVELKKTVKDRKFLLVLDDVWNEDQKLWEMLRKPLLHGARGSKILVTTRNGVVAEIMRTDLTHYLKQLCEEDCWLVFAKHAFENGESHADPKLKATRRKIVEKCRGLPFAAKVLGSLLRYMPTPEEWDEVLEGNTWELTDESAIIPVLQASYQYLPSHLQRCFAYSSIFPKDFAFRKERLVQLWMAQGFLVHPERREKMEILGDEYFNELVSRSFFQNSSVQGWFVMLDIINDLAHFVSGKSCVFMDGGSSQEVQLSTRHLSYMDMTPGELSSFLGTNCLRTFLSLQDKHYHFLAKVPQNLLQTLRLLRALSLRVFPMFELPESIGNLKHLRYLDLSGTFIKMLPDSICNLYNLQTLLLEDCYRLIKLPEKMYKLVNLRYLVIKENKLFEEMPINIGRLKNLKKLSFFKVGKQGGATIRELGQLSELGESLRICQLENVISPADALEARLKDKKYLKELHLLWSGTHDDLYNEVLEKLQPHKNLKKLSIDSFGGRGFPNWTADEKYSNMVSMKLCNCENCDSLPTLGQLPSLKELFISGFCGLVKVGAEFYGNNGTCAFPSLYELTFEKMSQWEEWCPCEVENAFPCLEQLSIIDCPKLKADLSLTYLCIADCLNLLSFSGRGLFFPNLLGLEIRDCNSIKLLGAQQVQTLSSPNVFPSTLTSLYISNCDKLVMELLYLDLIRGLNSLSHLKIIGRCEGVKSFPQEDCLTTSLEFLEIGGFSDLETLQYMGLHNLSSLRSLEINNCGKLQSLPQEGLPASLSSLRIKGCPQLVQRLQRDQGQDWDKIASIPYVHIDDERVLK